MLKLRKLFSIPDELFPACLSAGMRRGYVDNTDPDAGTLTNIGSASRAFAMENYLDAVWVYLSLYQPHYWYEVKIFQPTPWQIEAM